MVIVAIGANLDGNTDAADRVAKGPASSNDNIRFLAGNAGYVRRHLW